MSIIPKSTYDNVIHKSGDLFFGGRNALLIDEVNDAIAKLTSLFINTGINYIQVKNNFFSMSYSIYVTQKIEIFDPSYNSNIYPNIDNDYMCYFLSFYFYNNEIYELFEEYSSNPTISP